MHDHAREALALFEGHSRSDLDEDRTLCLAVVRLLEILGEAARRVSADVQAANPDIPWSRWIGLRNRLIHAYDQVDLDIVARILAKGVPRWCGVSTGSCAIAEERLDLFAKRRGSAFDPDVVDPLLDLLQLQAERWIRAPAEDLAAAGVKPN